MNATVLLERITKHFNVYSMNELSEKLETSKDAIYKWKKRNSIKPIKIKCKELGIYDQIFIRNEQINNEKIIEVNVSQIIEKLFNYYNVYTIAKLSIKIETDPKLIFKWKERKSIRPIQKKCRDLGIYDEIFKENTNSDNIYIKEEIIKKTAKIAAEYGMSANEFIESIIIKELRK